MKTEGNINRAPLITPSPSIFSSKKGYQILAISSLSNLKEKLVVFSPCVTTLRYRSFETRFLLSIFSSLCTVQWAAI